MTSHYTRRSVTTLHDFEGVLERPLDTLSFGLSLFHGHGSWLVCEEVALLHHHLHEGHCSGGICISVA